VSAVSATVIKEQSPNSLDGLISPHGRVIHELMNSNYSVVSLISILALLGYNPLPLQLGVPGESRQPNFHEEFYTAVAADFQDLGMCEKISIHAIDVRRPDFGTMDYRVTSQKSACYFYVALTTKNASLCDQVETIITDPPNKSEVSKSECLRALQDPHYGRNYTHEPVLPFFPLSNLLQEMGYRDEDLDAATYSQNPLLSPIYKFYETIRNTDAFKEKIQRWPDHTEPFSPDKARLADEDEFLAQMVAIDDSLSSFCEKVSSNAYVEWRNNYYHKVLSKSSLRDHCFSSIAQNTNSLELCGKISEVNAISKKGCVDMIALQTRPEYRGKLGHSGPAYFPEMKMFTDVLEKLGYDKPVVVRQDALKWSNFYQYLKYRATPEEKQEFIKRAKALPSS